MSEKVYLYPKWVRLWHWVNALMFLALIISGISMQYAIWIRFDYAVSIHNIAGVILTFSYLFFLVFHFFTSNKKYYRIKKKKFHKKLKKQFSYYISGIFKKEAPPYPISEKRKFNPLQKLSYIIAMFILMPFVIITGLALLFPEFIIPKVFGFSGLHLTDLFHIFIGFILSIFMFIHIYFSTMGKSPASNFKGMITGWHEHA